MKGISSLAGTALVKSDLIPNNRAVFTERGYVVGVMNLDTGDLIGEMSATLTVSPEVYEEIIRSAEADSGLKVT